PHDAEEQRPEQPLEVGDEALGAEGHCRVRDQEMQRHNSSLPGSSGTCQVAGDSRAALTLGHPVPARHKGWPSSSPRKYVGWARYGSPSRAPPPGAATRKPAPVMLLPSADSP